MEKLNEKLKALEKLKGHYIYGHLVSYNKPHLEQLCDIQFKKTDNTARINHRGSYPRNILVIISIKINIYFIFLMKILLLIF